MCWEILKELTQILEIQMGIALYPPATFTELGEMMVIN